MNPEEMKDLKELIEFLKENKISEFELEKGELKVQLKFQQEGTSAGLIDAATLVRLLGAGNQFQHVPASLAAPVMHASASLGTPSAPAPAAPPTAAEEVLHTVKSPIVGTFYESSSPGASAFVKAGDQVEVGQALCIIEAMKLMNEIECDVAGEIVKRLVENGQPVEYGQPLFAVRAR